MFPTIVFTENALQDMQRRGISRESVEYALSHRDDDYQTRKGTVARYTLPDGRMLKVRYQSDQNNAILVIAAFHVA